MTSFQKSLRYHFAEAKRSGDLLSQGHLSRLSGVAGSTLSEQMNQVKDCRPVTQQKIARVFGKNLPEFLNVGRLLLLQKDDKSKKHRGQILTIVRQVKEQEMPKTFQSVLLDKWPGLLPKMELISAAIAAGEMDIAADMLRKMADTVSEADPEAEGLPEDATKKKAYL